MSLNNREQEAFFVGLAITSLLIGGWVVEEKMCSTEPNLLMSAISLILLCIVVCFSHEYRKNSLIRQTLLLAAIASIYPILSIAIYGLPPCE